MYNNLDPQQLVHWLAKQPCPSSTRKPKLKRFLFTTSKATQYIELDIYLTLGPASLSSHFADKLWCPKSLLLKSTVELRYLFVEYIYILFKSSWIEIQSLVDLKETVLNSENSRRYVSSYSIQSSLRTEPDVLYYDLLLSMTGLRCTGFPIDSEIVCRRHDWRKMQDAAWKTNKWL